MREALLELKRFLLKLRHGIPWQDDSAAYHYVPLLAILMAIGIGMAIAGALWYVSPVFRFNPWALIVLLAPAVGGFYLTYLFDLLEIGLGWRAFEILLQIVLSLILLIPASEGLLALSAGLVVAIVTWTTAVRLGSDLVAFRPDRLTPGHNGAHGEMEHPGLQRFFRSQFGLLAAIAGLAGFAARWQSEPAPWWISTITGIGIATAVVAVLVLISWVHRAVMFRTWETQERVVQVNVLPVWHVWTYRLAALAGFVGLVLPANLSPIGGLSFNGLFEAINRHISPFFVRSKISHTVAGDSVTTQVLEQVTEADALPFTGVINLLMYLAITVVVLWALRKFWSMTGVQKSQRKQLEYGKEKGFWRWLWQAIASWFRRATDMLMENPMQEKRASGKRAPGKYSKKAQVPTEPYALVLYLYNRFLDRAANYQRQRKQYETALEFHNRLLPDAAEQDATSIAELTQMYQVVRYSGVQTDAGIANTFKKVWAAAVRALKHLKPV